VLDTGVLFIRVFSGVLVGDIRQHRCRESFGYQADNSVSISPGNAAKLIVKTYEDIAEPVQFRQELQPGKEEIAGKKLIK
jgi:hypothetical protein